MLDWLLTHGYATLLAELSYAELPLHMRYVACFAAGFIVLRVIDGWYSRDFLLFGAAIGMAGFGGIFLYGTFVKLPFAVLPVAGAWSPASVLAACGVVSGLVLRKRLFNWFL
jgi:hypothetical protein